MGITRKPFGGRRAWQVGSGEIELTILEGGGHLAALTLADKPGLNPFWQPVWKTVEPWQYRATRDAASFGGSALLASIAGHVFCLGHFGPPSAAEAAAGLDTHGEATIMRWKESARRETKTVSKLSLSCALLKEGLFVDRTYETRAGSHVITVTTVIRSLLDFDRPFTVCEHGTFSDPFLEKGVTVLDLSADKGQVISTGFSKKMRLAPDAPFEWPLAPGAAGESVDLRRIERAYRTSGDFAAMRMDVTRDDAWASMLNPKLGAAVVYQWRRSDYPWTGNWEENRCRNAAPWAGQTLARGVEFANSPFPCPLEAQVRLGRLFNTPTYGWLPALGRVETVFKILMLPAPAGAAGVADVRTAADGSTEIDWVL
ncbi:MAG: hypothetical protein FJ222_09445 [Lentisphaerae bacterium]|nr:hypothetical protein [Lentisphaerota bacterium]